MRPILFTIILLTLSCSKTSWEEKCQECVVFEYSNWLLHQGIKTKDEWYMGLQWEKTHVRGDVYCGKEVDELKEAWDSSWTSVNGFDYIIRTKCRDYE